jgi:ureidoacrylate peracid hydrolase
MHDAFSAKYVAHGLEIDPKHAAVLVVDMLNDFCKPGGAMVLGGYERLVQPQQQVIAAGRKAGAPICFIADTHRTNVRRDREFLKRAPHCLEGTWGAHVIDELDARPDDVFVTKRRYSAFFNTDLDLTLKDLQIDTVVVMGVVTNICVRSTVHDAFFNGYRVLVPDDCVAATGPREQDSSLYDIATHYGLVSDAEAIEAALLSGAVITNKISAL